MKNIVTEIRGRVAIITIDNPPVHALATPVRAGLIQAIKAMNANPAVSGAVIATAGRTFIAGADMREMDRPLEEPQLPEVIATIAASPKPIVAALHGNVLGGGFEVAMACRGRVADGRTSFALPEVKIGLIPGASGTQRLMRMVDFAMAVRMVTSAKPIGAAEAQAFGFIHQIVEGDPLAAAVQLVESGAIDNAELFPPVSQLEARPAHRPKSEEIDMLRAEVKKAAKGQAAPMAALELMEATANLAFKAGLAEERAVFIQLRASREAKALRRLFLAEREAGRLPELASVPALEVKTIGVVGAGLMGCGIAYSALAAGYRVILAEGNTEALERGRQRMTELFDGSQKSGRLSPEKRQRMESVLSLTTAFADFAEADLVIEAVFENLEVKRDVFTRLDAVVRPDCLLATNTSYLDLDAIAAMTKDPSRFLGLHFFSPAHIMRLLEVVRGAKTSPQTLQTGIAVGRKLGKIPIPTGVCEGFCGNRILKAYRIVAESMVEEGATPEEVDAAMTGFGFPMGPFAVQDMAGLEIAYANRKLKPAIAADGRQLGLVELLVDSGRLGRKNGKGWYAYPEGARGGVADPELLNLLHLYAARKDIPQRTINQTAMRDALLAAMKSEGQAILREGIVARPEDIDLVLVHGYGFPSHKGGPMFEG